MMGVDEALSLPPPARALVLRRRRRRCDAASVGVGAAGVEREVEAAGGVCCTPPPWIFGRVVLLVLHINLINLKNLKTHDGFSCCLFLNIILLPFHVVV